MSNGYALPLVTKIEMEKHNQQSKIAGKLMGVGGDSARAADARRNRSAVLFAIAVPWLIMGVWFMLIALLSLVLVPLAH